MEWDALILETARRAGIDRAEAARTLNSFFDTLIEKMATEDQIQLREDFGCFEMREAGGLQSAHPQAITKCRRTPIFKKAGELKKKLRQSDAEYCAMLRGAGRTAQAERLASRRKAMPEIKK